MNEWTPARADRVRQLCEFHDEAKRRSAATDQRVDVLYDIEADAFRVVTTDGSAYSAFDRRGLRYGVSVKGHYRNGVEVAK